MQVTSADQSIMVFAYYNKLSRTQKKIYNKSDSIVQVKLKQPGLLLSDVQALQSALSSEDRKISESVANTLLNKMLRDIGAPELEVRVLSARPSRDWGELHGLYEPVEGNCKGKITVWMRTAKHKKVVAFKSFLRTLLHELCHHLDYEYYLLADSFHTEGFFKRESSLFKQIMPAE